MVNGNPDDCLPYQQNSWHIKAIDCIIVYITHLEYAVQVWEPTLQRDKDMLEKVQRLASSNEQPGI